MSKNKFDIEYNQWLSQVNEDVDLSLWENIQDRLDLIETWDNIAYELDKQLPVTRNTKPSIFLKTAVTIAAMFLLIFIPVKQLREQNPEPSYSLSNFSLPGVIEEDSRITGYPVQVDGEEIIHADVLIQTDDRIGKYLLMAKSKPGVDILHEIPEINDRNNSKDFIPEIMYGQINYDEFIVSAPVSEPSSDEIQPLALSTLQRQTKEALFTLVDAGLLYSYKNTWLLNYETFNGLNPQKLGNTLMTFRKDIGFSSTWAIRGKPVLGIEFLWNSGNGQKYQQYIDASYVVRDINLQYWRLQALYISDFKKFPGQPLFGAYFAGLNKGMESLGNLSSVVREYYRDIDYGLVIGHQFNIRFQNRIIITPGLRLSFNLVNLFEGDENLPSQFKKTRNFTAGFNLGFSYRLF